MGCLELQACPVPSEIPATPVELVASVRLGSWVTWACREVLDPEELLDSPDYPVDVEPQVPSEHLDQLVLRGSAETQVIEGLWVLVEVLAPLVSRVLRDKQVLLVHQDYQALGDHQDQLV